MNELPKPQGPFEAFRERVIDKIKNDMGTLLDDAELGVLVKEAVQKSFFTSRRIPKPGAESWRNETIEVPSWFQGAVMDAVEPLLKRRIVEYVAENRQTIDDTIKAAIAHDRLQFLAAAVIGDRVKDGMVGAAMDLVNQLRSAGLIRY